MPRTTRTAWPGGLLTRIPSHLDTARRGRSALSVRIERKAGISAAPNQMAPKFIKDSWWMVVVQESIEISRGLENLLLHTQ